MILEDYLIIFGLVLGKLIKKLEYEKDSCKEARDDFPYYLGIMAVNETLFELEKFLMNTSREFDTYKLIEEYKKKSAFNVVLDNNITGWRLASTTEDEKESNCAEYQLNSFEYDMLLDRNRMVTDRIIEEMNMNKDQKFFFAFGVAHFFGDGSVIELLKEKGFTVERV